MPLRAWILLGLLAWPAGAESGVAATVDFVSEDVFRGVSRGQGVSIQPSVAYDLLESLTASVWTNVRLGGSIAVSEAEYSLEWRWLTAKRFELSGGWIYYDTYRAAADPRRPETAEFFGGLSLKTTGRPSLYVYLDYDRRPGWYASLAASHEFLLPDYRGSFELGGELGLELGRLDGFHDARVSVAFSRYVGDWRVSPALDLHFPAGAADPGANGIRPVFRVSATRRW